jgi:hypothetical protein
MLVHNSPVRLCCGKPAGQCTCHTRNEDQGGAKPITAYAGDERHHATAEAARATLDSGHESAVRHAAGALLHSKAGESNQAARRHVLAARMHENAATFARRDGDGERADMHDGAAALHRKAHSMHAASIPEEADDDDDLTANVSDVLDLPEVIFPARPAARSLTVNLRGTVEADDDCLALPEPVVLYNYACSPEAARAVFNAQKLGPNETDTGNPRHSWDRSQGEPGGVNLGTTAGNIPFAEDRRDPAHMTPEELLEFIGAHDELTRVNRKRMGLPDSDIDVSDILPEPGAIGQLLGERRVIRKTDQQ